MPDKPIEAPDEPSTIPPEHDAAIGRLARSWGHLEYVADLLLWELADLEQQFGSCITSQIGSIHPKMKAIGALVRLRGGSPKLQKDLSAFARSLHSVGELRARAVHDGRMIKQSTGEVVRWQTTASPQGIVFGPVVETAEDVRIVRRRIAARARALAELRERVHNEILAPGKQKPVALLRTIDSNGAD